jgi:hypothetical protein
MYGLLRPFWWRHVDESWVHRHTRYDRLTTAEPRIAGLPDSYVAVKFYFNDGFPATESNRAFVRDTVRELAQRTTVVSLTTGLALDDHGGAAVEDQRVIAPALRAAPSRNLCVQSAIVAHATSFVGTYGGFAYLAPFHTVPSVAYYSDPGGFSLRHLSMARSALATLSSAHLLDVRPASHLASDGPATGTRA